MDQKLNSQAMMMDNPGPLGLNPGHLIFVTDPLAELQTATGAILNQAPQLLEALTNFDLPNKYNVFVITPMGVKYMFRAIEYSSCCARCCCDGSSRPLQMSVKHIASIVEYQTDVSKTYLTINKPCRCSCFCCCRPYMDVRHVDTGKFFGRIREPCVCCDPTVQLYDCQGVLRYVISANCCQDGLCCGAACQKLNDIEFLIYQNGMVVGRLRKLSANVAEFFTKADSYSVEFPSTATPEEKMLLITAGLMIDYSYFENEEDAGAKSHMEGY